jgi:hypothetical protein
MNKRFLVLPVALVAFSVFTLGCGPSAAGDPTPVATTVPTPTPTEVPPSTPAGLSQDELTALQAELDANIEKWRQSGVTSYEFEHQVNCFCPEDLRSPVVVAVNDGVIASRTYAETGQAVAETFQDRFIDVPGLFEMVQDAIDQDADRISVEFDAELGYPTSIDIDYNFLMADEEVGITVNSFK